jgi:monoamine oxidase
MARPAPASLLSRREVLVLGGMGAATVLLSRCTGPVAPTGGGAVRLPFGPIDRTIGDVASRAFSGDEPEAAHKVLWDRDAFLSSVGGTPVAAEQVPLVVVGGGLAGLTAAWQLRVHRPVVLERARRFGGNSRGESWRGADYAIGAAYFIRPDEGTAIASLLATLDLDDAPRVKQTEDPVVIAGSRFERFWDGESTTDGAEQVRRLARHFLSVLAEEGGEVFPEIPVVDPARRAELDALDRRTFHAYLCDVAGGPLHPHVEAVIEHYCWSSFGASMTELSAAAGLNFYAAEFGEVCVLPGGNAAVVERLVERLAAELPPQHLRPASLVLEVACDAAGAVVTYADRAGTLRSLRARAVVMACPKFVAQRVVRDLEPERRVAIDRLRYRAYLVANVLLRRPLADDFYDLFLAGDGRGDLRGVERAAIAQGVTDVVLGTWARPERDRAILTLYRAVPYDGARLALLGDDAYATVRAEFERQITAEILPLVRAGEGDVVDLRLARWGHPLPVAEAGLIADGVPEVLRAPFAGRVFFAQQDDWALPAFETAITEALLVAPEVERVLRRG